ncbi:alpha-amylase family glycosyl hydrolase [Flavilitoribacter nigricans]|uniref:Glycosyl hydrolase family 13 catalytic domain-containing protein n=1 Tax=Flavilitoribacter nigricans (strain ATCC 23147 / DSM 23189 / NBRC 102662 / NCIMB 1420 / SS-2) TaxID=1122177 RepID=A0A2D0N4V5_FLAN2|nr:alpha-amylase family glycosyl hydrolase [Flavilitoribacter nigricans]PHN03420.1 hypothetical protein CRP01_27440 [Flavilitoribacter nigricans DSM 23189 = NBRC 102662]
MKLPLIRTLWLAVGLSSLSLASGQDLSLTLQVDMRQQNVSAQGVHVAGSFQSEAGFPADWNPASTPMSDPDGDKIYTITLLLPAGTYEYKFINGNAWGSDESPPAECSVTNNNNRIVTLGSDLTLPPVPFNACNAQLRLAVNMSEQTVSPDGVHVMGDFQQAAGFPADWDPASIELLDQNGDGTYEITLPVPNGTYQYVFVNGNTVDGAEIIPEECSVTGANDLRYRQADTDSEIIYCFGTCTPCDPAISTSYETHWWNDAVFYEIFVRSFYDSDNDGIGDFRGIIEKLDYLNDGDPETDTDLGITGIWLMPMMASPSYHGYDVTDYYATEPDYGTMADFEALLEAAHARGIKVIIDFVMNHSSDQHPWFTQSANSQSNFRDWYIWSDNNPGFNGPWGQNVWHARNGDYYYGLFWGGMPDLNYSHPPLKEEMFNITRFWLDKGVDGFRLDAIKYLDEDGTLLENTPETFTLLEEFNTVYKTARPDAFTVGEVWSATSSVVPYVQNNRLDICFDFDLAGAILNAVNGGDPANIQNQFGVLQAAYPKLQYGTFLTNHDIDRVFSQLGNDASRMKLAAALYLSMPGVPFIYYGEEVGMTGTGIHENIRRPMQWSTAANGGFSSHTPWYGLGSNVATNNVATMAAEPGSLWQHYRKLVHIRNDEAALRRGYLLGLESNTARTLGYARIYEEEAVLVVSNFNTAAISPEITLPVSSLTPGTYSVRELYSSTAMGTVEINEQGGFGNWTAAAGSMLNPRETWFLKLASTEPTPVREQLAPELDFSLRPNPASDQVDLQFNDLRTDGGRIIIFNASGRSHYETNITGASLSISTQEWPAGLYFIKVVIDGRVRTQSLLIQH